MEEESSVKVEKRFTEEELQEMLRESAKIGAREALAERRKVKKVDTDDNDDSDSDNVINPKVVKQLKDTVAVFTALKDLSSNPLQKTIEETVGVQAQSVVQSAFARPQYQNRDLMDTILNSQFAYGLGTGIGNRGPELVETMAKTFGNEKTANFIGDVIKGYGGDKTTSTSNPRLSTSEASWQTDARSASADSRIPKIQAPNPPQVKAPDTASAPAPVEPQQLRPASASEQGARYEVGEADSRTHQSVKASDSDRELVLDLNANNPEHIAAYAETQGGLPIEAAKNMLILHQQGFLEQMKNEGKDVSKYIHTYVHPIENNNKKLKMKPIMKA